jgi:hypothetical protein
VWRVCREITETQGKQEDSKRGYHEHKLARQFSINSILGQFLHSREGIRRIISQLAFRRDLARRGRREILLRRWVVYNLIRLRDRLRLGVSLGNLIDRIIRDNGIPSMSRCGPNYQRPGAEVVYRLD